MHRALPAFLLITSHLLIFWRVWAGATVVLDRDLAYLHYPMKAAAARLWLEGRLPEWDPGTLNGQPLAANPNYAAFYPATPALGGDDPVRAGSVVLAAHHLWMLIGFLALARRSRASPLATVLGGLMLSLSGPVISTIPYYNLLVGLSWAPWLAWTTTLGSRSVRIALGAVAVALALLAGSPFAAFAGLCTAIVWISLDRSKSRLVALAELVAAAAAGCVAASVQLLPAAAFFTHSLRAEPRPYVQSLGYYSFHPLRVLELVVPGVFGNPAGITATEFWGGGLGDGGGWLLDSPYLGLTVLVLLLLTAGRRQLPVLALAAVALVLASGRYVGLHKLLVIALPPLAQLRYPEKYLLLIPLLLALSLLKLELPGGVARARIATAGIVAIGLAAIGLAGAGAIAAALPEIAGADLTGTAADLAVGRVRVGCLLAAFWIAATTAVLAAPMRDTLRNLGLTLFIAADLFTAQVSAGYQLPVERVAETPRLAELLQAQGCRRLYNMVLDDVALHPPPMVTGYTDLIRESLYPRIGTLYGIRYALDPPVDLMETDVMGRLAVAAQQSDNVDRTTLDRLGISHVLHVDPRPPFGAASTTRTPVGYLSRLGPGTSLWYMPGDRAPPEPALAQPSSEPLEWNLRVRAPGLLATDISYAPGWRAYADGRPVDCKPTELGTIAVPVAPGTVHLRLEYRAPALRLGLVISAVAWLALGLVPVAARLRSHDRRSSRAGRPADEPRSPRTTPAR